MIKSIQGRADCLVRGMGGHEPAMMVSLKPVRDQVMVVTGASSGIRLVTARLVPACGREAGRHDRQRDGYVLEIASSEVVPVR